MITLAEARQIARLHLDSLEEEHRKAEETRKDLTRAEREILGLGAPDNLRLVIVDESTVEGDFGWVFFYDSRKHLETGAAEDSLAGNAPLLVSREDGSLYITGTAYPVQRYIDNFIRTGDPEGRTNEKDA